VSYAWGGVRDWGGSRTDSPRWRMLNIECLRDCICGSVLERPSLEIGVESKTAGVDSIREPVEVSGEPPGDTLSGLAMRKPPNDCERLKSPSMALPVFKICCCCGFQEVCLDSSKLDHVRAGRWCWPPIVR
jgi:hypothetical protein